MTWAAPSDLLTASQEYGVPAPPVTERAGVLDRATTDINTYLGVAWDPALLTAVQLAALRRACCAQALYRHAQPDRGLGLEDGVTAIGPITVSARPVATFSGEAEQLLSGLGLFTRCGTVMPSLLPLSWG